MSNDKPEKYGKEELELINGVIESYKNASQTFAFIKDNNNKKFLVLKQDHEDKNQIYITINQKTLDYLTLVLDKILEDNFDEEFIKEKMKK